MFNGGGHPWENATRSARLMKRGFEVLTFNCWIVLVYEVTLDQLDGQAGLSDATTADNHQLVFS
jgi:hypothetical protein